MESGCLMLSTSTYLIGTFNTLEGLVVGKDYFLDLKPFLPPSLPPSSLPVQCICACLLSDFYCADKV